jgi:TBC1 domain family protein 5
MMLRILFIYAKLNPTLAYKQGMHELLAPMIYVLEKEKVERYPLQQARLF